MFPKRTLFRLENSSQATPETASRENKSAFLHFSVFVLTCAFAHSAFAAALTWDADLGTAGAQDGSGVWTTGSAGWTGTSGNVNWTAGDTATFGAGTNGTYAITIGGPITTGTGSLKSGGLNFLNLHLHTFGHQRANDLVWNGGGTV